MEYRILGRTGIRVSAVALGCEGFMGKTSAEIVSDFDYATELGVNFVDIYSPNPELRTNIGAAIAGRRKDFVIQGHLCTVWEDGQYLRTRDADKTSRSFKQQLRQLGTDYLDIGMIHYVDSEADFKTVFEGPIIEMAERLKAEGRIRFIGMSSHNPTVALRAAQTGKVDVLMFSINPYYDLLPPSDDVEMLFDMKSYDSALENIDPERQRLYDFCAREGVGIDVMKVFCGGDLLCEERSPLGRALTEVQALEYALTRPAVAAVMVGCKNKDEIKAAAAWCDATTEQRDYAKVIAGLDKFSWKGHCMYCGHCAPCTAGIDIASVNKFSNLASAQGSVPETVREHYRSLEKHASDCLACGACEERCPFGVEIIENMRVAAKRFGY